MNKELTSKLIGNRFFTIDEQDNVHTVRILKFLNEKTVSVLNYDTKHTEKMDWQELVNEYNLLNPNGVILFSIVKMPKGKKINGQPQEEVEDVIVSLFKLPNNDGIPFCVCRQNIIDIHNALVKPNEAIVGCCMSQESIPEGFDFKAMRSCNSLVYHQTVSVYLDDHIDEIFRCIKSNKYDSVLNNLYENNIEKLTTEYLKKEAREKSVYGGFCRTLKDLLYDNEFIYDFKRAFGIEYFSNIDLEFPEDTEEMYLNSESEFFDIVSKRLGYYTNNGILVPFDYDIDLTKLEKDYLLVSDKSERVFVLTYDKGNNYVYDIEDQK